MKAAVFSCLGLGDGLIAMVLSHNLQQNGWEVTTFHPSLMGLQRWFPHLTIQRFPTEDELASVLKEYDQFFLFFEKTPWMQSILSFCQKNYPQKLRVLNPIATPNRDYPYWEEGKFDGRKTFVDNLYIYSRDILKLPKASKTNGMIVPTGLTPRKYPKRVLIHPTSSRPGKNWPLEKYLLLAERLKNDRYEPVIVLSPQEREELKIEAPLFSNFHELASFACESGYMIGNDSGIGHLASCLGLPTVTICRHKHVANFWRPAWGPGKVILPPAWLPNLKGLRLRDRFWKESISVGAVCKAFINMRSNHKLIREEM